MKIPVEELFLAVEKKIDEYLAENPSAVITGVFLKSLHEHKGEGFQLGLLIEAVEVEKILVLK